MKTLILTLILTILSAPAFAESQIFLIPSTDYDNKGAKVSQFLKNQSLKKADTIPVGDVYVSIVHPDFLEPNQFGLMFKKANSETGCFEYSPIEYEASYIENFYMDINLKHYRRTVKETQNPEFDCNQKSKIISAMIVLNADDLANKKVRQLRLSNGNVRDAYDVLVTDNSVRLTPQSMVAFKAVGLMGADKSYIEHRFTDTSLVTLQVPMAKDGEDVAQAVRDLAYRRALQPVIEREGLDTSGTNNVFYFTDPNGTTLEQIGEDGYMEFGTINVSRPYDGPNGRVGMPTPLKVFLTRPNVTL